MKSFIKKAFTHILAVTMLTGSIGSSLPAYAADPETAAVTISGITSPGGSGSYEDPVQLQFYRGESGVLKFSAAGENAESIRWSFYDHTIYEEEYEEPLTPPEGTLIEAGESFSIFDFLTNTDLNEDTDPSSFEIGYRRYSPDDPLVETGDYIFRAVATDDDESTADAEIYFTPGVGKKAGNITTLNLIIGEDSLRFTSFDLYAYVGEELGDRSIEAVFEEDTADADKKVKWSLTYEDGSPASWPEGIVGETTNTTYAITGTLAAAGEQTNYYIHAEDKNGNDHVILARLYPREGSATLYPTEESKTVELGPTERYQFTNSLAILAKKSPDKVSVSTAGEFPVYTIELNGSTENKGDVEVSLTDASGFRAPNYRKLPSCDVTEKSYTLSGIGPTVEQHLAYLIFNFEEHVHDYEAEFNWVGDFNTDPAVSVKLVCKEDPSHVVEDLKAETELKESNDSFKKWEASLVYEEKTYTDQKTYYNPEEPDPRSWTVSWEWSGVGTDPAVLPSVHAVFTADQDGETVSVAAGNIWSEYKANGKKLVWKAEVRPDQTPDEGYYSSERTVDVETGEENEGNIGLYVWYDDMQHYSYTGKAITPAVKVYFNDNLLVEKTDYTLSYSDNVNAGKAKITVTGKGNYAISATSVEYTIEPLRIDDASNGVTVENVTLIKGKAFKAPAVKCKGKALKAGTDYELTYNDSKDAPTEPGIYWVKVSGKGNYTGEIFGDLAIVEKDTVKGLKVTYDKNLAVFNEKKEFDQTKFIGSIHIYDKTTEVTDQFYIGLSNVYDAGKNALINISPKEECSYSGTRSVKFTLKGTRLNKNMFTLEGSVPYTGEVYNIYSVVRDKPIFTTDLQEGKDFWASYVNNTKSGTAKIILNGCGAYEGSVTLSFKITKAEDISVWYDGYDPETGKGNVPFTAGGTVPRNLKVYGPEGEYLREGTDYTVTYDKKSGKKVGDTGRFTVKGKGNYGSKTFEYMVIPGAFDYFFIDTSVKEVKQNAKKTKIEDYLPANTNSVKLIDTASGKQIPNSEYNMEFCDWNGNSISGKLEENRTIFVKISSKGVNYEKAEGRTVILPAIHVYKDKLKASDFKVKDQYYTGNPVEIDLSQIEGAFDKDGRQLIEIIDYKNNIKANGKKATATVIVRGIGEDGGILNLKFRILPAEK